MSLIKFLRIMFCLPMLPILGAGGGAGGGAGDNGGAAGGADDDGEDPAGGAGDTGDKGGADNGKTFTQEEVNRMMAKEKKQGSKAILKELGIEKVEELKTIIGEYKESHKNDDNVASTEVAKIKADAQAAERRATMADAKVQAMMLGARPEDVEDVIALAMAKVEDDSDDFKEIISEIKTKHPQMFVGSSDEENKPGNKGTGNSPGNKSAKSSNDGGEESIGTRLANLKKASNPTKSSYFSK